MVPNQRVLLIASEVLGNSTASRRFTEVLQSLAHVDLTVLSFSQDDLDNIRLPTLFGKFQALRTYFFLRTKLRAIAHQPFDVVLAITCQPLLSMHGLFKNSKIAMWFDALPFHSGGRLVDHLFNVASRLVYSWAFRRVDTLLAMSEWAQKQIPLFAFARLSRVEVCYIGIPLQRWRKPSLGLPPDNPINKRVARVIIVGNDARRKGLIDFFSYVKNKQIDCSAFQFTIVTNEYNPALIGLAKELGITLVNDITHDKLDRLIALYQGADIFFLPTKADMLPNVLIESAAAGLPIVATDVGAINEVVVSGQNGILVGNGDWPGFVQALHHVLLLPRARLPIFLEKFSEEQFRRVILRGLS